MIKWEVKRHKPADEGFNALAGDWSHAHGHGLWRGEPVRIVITRCKVTYVVDVAEEERHRAELPQAATGCTYRLERSDAVYL